MFDNFIIRMLNNDFGEDTEKDNKWMQKAVKHPGSLRKALHVPAGKNIPASKLSKAANSRNPSLAKKARLAQTFKKYAGKKKK